MKTLIMCSAIPASGKSTWARFYASRTPNTYIVSSDDIRKELFGSYVDMQQPELVWSTFEQRIHEYGKIDDVTVVLDALNDVNWVREKYVKCAPEFDRYILVIFPHDIESSRHFNNMRNADKKVPDEALEMLSKKFEEPTPEVRKLFHEIWEIHYDEEMWKKIGGN